MPVTPEVKSKAAKEAEAANPPADPPAPVMTPTATLPPPAPPRRRDDPPPGPPADPPAPVDDAPRSAIPPELMASAKRLFAVFQGSAVGFGPYPAALLAAHCLATREGVESLGRTEAEHWALTFARLHPVPWFDCKNGNLNGFVASLRRSNIDGPSAQEYREIASAIQG